MQQQDSRGRLRSLEEILQAQSGWRAVAIALVHEALVEGGVNPATFGPRPLLVVRGHHSFQQAVEAWAYEAFSSVEFVDVEHEKRVSTALQDRLSRTAHETAVVVFAPPAADLGAIARAADFDVMVLPLSWRGVKRLARKLVGGGPGPWTCPPQPSEILQGIRPSHWFYAARENHTDAQSFIESLVRIAAGPPLKEPPTEGRTPIPTIPVLPRKTPSGFQPERIQSSLKIADCPGMRAAELWARDLIADLADYREGLLQWSEIDRGILLAGPPGCGKTRFARALAGEAGVPVIASSAADWIAYKDGHLGSYTEALKSTFAAARENAPCILFIDEIDSCGNRSSGGSNSGWFAGAVAALLQELDGIGGREGVVVVGATNRADEIDPAVKRSGRLDRLVEIPLPDGPARSSIWRVHLDGALEGVDLAPLVQRSDGGSGADIERWCREARRVARRARRPMNIDDVMGVVDVGDQEEERFPIGFQVA